MPYYLKRKGDLYFVVDANGKRYSESGLDKATARKQLTALNIAHAKKEVVVPKMTMPTNCGVDDKCSKKASLKGDLTMFHTKLGEMEQMRMNRMRNTTSESVFSMIRKVEDEQKAHKEITPPPTVMKTESIKGVDIEPVKKVRKIRVAEPPDVVEVPEFTKSFSEMKDKERKSAYKMFESDGKKGDDVPVEFRKGYKTYLNKQKR